MSGPERRSASLGRRTDPSFPQNLRFYMARFPNEVQKKKHQEKVRETQNFYTKKIKDLMEAEAQRRLEDHNKMTK